MAKAKGWLMSLDAHGQIGNKLVGRMKKGVNSVAPYTAPGGSPSESQRAWREIWSMAAAMKQFALGYQKWNFDFLEATARITGRARTAENYASMISIYGASIMAFANWPDYPLVDYRQCHKLADDGGIVNGMYWQDWPIFATTSVDSYLDVEYGFCLSGMVMNPAPEGKWVYDWQEIWFGKDEREDEYTWVEMRVPHLKWDTQSHGWLVAWEWVPVTGIVDWENLTWL